MRRRGCRRGFLDLHGVTCLQGSHSRDEVNGCTPSSGCAAGRQLARSDLCTYIFVRALAQLGTPCSTSRALPAAPACSAAAASVI